MLTSGQFTLTAIEDSLHLELTSSSAVMVYDKTTLVSGSVTTTATLYRGALAVQEGVTYKLGTKSGVTATISGNTVVVSAMSAASGYVEVQATLGSAVYTTKFYVSKVLRPASLHFEWEGTQLKVWSDDEQPPQKGVELQGEYGERGAGMYNITTAPSSYTTVQGGFTPTYRISLSTVKTQSGAEKILIGDSLRYSYYIYPVGYVSASYVYLGARVSVRGAAGAAGADGRTDTMIADAGHITHIKGGSYTPAVINIEHVRFVGGQKVAIPESEQWKIIASAIVSYTNSDGEVELDYAGWEGSETYDSQLTLDLAAAEADIKENYYPDAEIQSIELQLGEFGSGVGVTYERKSIAVTNIAKYRRMSVQVGNKYLHIEDGIVVGYDSSPQPML